MGEVQVSGDTKTFLQGSMELVYGRQCSDQAASWTTDESFFSITGRVEECSTFPKQPERR